MKMKNIVDVINESRTNTKDITAYVNSWLKTPDNVTDMYKVIGAIVQGCHDALAYREDPKYFDSEDKKYNDATEVLRNLVAQMK